MGESGSNAIDGGFWNTDHIKDLFNSERKYQVLKSPSSLASFSAQDVISGLLINRFR